MGIFSQAFIRIDLKLYGRFHLLILMYILKYLFFDLLEALSILQASYFKGDFIVISVG